MTATAAGPARPDHGRVSARRVAFDVLRTVREDDAYANLVLPPRLDRAHLSREDAGFATELAYGTLRLAGYYDAIIALASGRVVARIDPVALDVLRLGVHQHLALGTAPHAVVNESVSLVREVGRAHAARFVNAVLRRVTERTADAWRDAVASAEADPESAFALVHAHPRWIVAALTDALAAEGKADELTALLEADNRAPQVNAVVPPGAAVDVSGLTPDRYSPIGFQGVPRERLTGTIRVQDEGSQLAALALVAARPVRPGEKWVDMCAGPGGKAIVLAAAARAGGAEFTANDLVPARAGLVRTGLAAVGLADVDVTEDDARHLSRTPERYDRILLDAPCTGLGALRRRPESRWRKSPADLANLTRLQADLLDAAVTALVPDGLIAYVTCSPHLSETRDQIAGVLSRHPEIRCVATRAVLEDVVRSPLPPTGDGDSVQLWPHRHHTDAMFIQLLTKVDA